MFSITDIEKKNKELQEVSNKLKADFFGIDDSIDQFINSVRVWYVMPDIMSRPIIVNLWGMTGIGKTDLIRKFVKYINMQHSFVEMQMDTNGGHDSIQSLIDLSELKEEEQSILLLDEFQRFASIDETGKEIRTKKLQDIWMLLSDGKFQTSSDNKRALVDIFMYDMWTDDAYNNNEEEAKESGNLVIDEKTEEKPAKQKKKRKYSTDYWSACRMKKCLKLSYSTEEIMKWSKDKKNEIIRKALKEDSVYDGKAFKKMLIIITGNIDEAYSFASSVSETDYDADLFFEKTKGIDILKIKEALLKRFKPEQISRLGNNHIIYKSLNKDAYKNIIKRTVLNINNTAFDMSGISINIDDNVINKIYSNGVFPTQGVRPVLSTISNIYENYIPLFIYEAVKRGSKNIYVWYDGLVIKSKTDDGHISEYAVNLMIDKIKSNKTNNDRAISAVHEAGHVLLYVLINKIAPPFASALTASSGKNGFINTHIFTQTRDSINNLIATLMAGAVAEEIVFNGNRTVGSDSDRLYATSLAGQYIRISGFGPYNSRFGIETESSITYYSEFEGSSEHIEKLVSNGINTAKEAIINNKKLFFDIIYALKKNESINDDFIIEICKNNGFCINKIPANEHHFESDFSKMLDEWILKNKI